VDTCFSLVLYGGFEQRRNAQLLLENLPQVKRIDTDSSTLRIVCSESCNENSLIPLLRTSGISGFRLLKS